MIRWTRFCTPSAVVDTGNPLTSVGDPPYKPTLMKRLCALVVLSRKPTTL
jgi:hypothetical protein